MPKKSVPTAVKRTNWDFEVLKRGDILKILDAVAYDKAFFFFEDIGRPTGDFAVSISDFCSKIKEVPPKSIAFHLKRGDFERWISEVIGDRDLSSQMGKLRTSKTRREDSDALRTKILTTVSERVVELQSLWQNALTWLEDSPI